MSDTPKVDWKTKTTDVLYALQHSGRNKRAVLFIHGFTGDAKETWINTKTKSSFANLIFTDEDLSDFDVFSFQYSTTAISGPSIKKIALQLTTEIEDTMSRYEDFVLITHSMGGLVAMRYILDQLRAGKSLPIVGLILYGVPVSGSYLVTMAKMAGTALKFALPKGGGIFSWLLGNHDQIEQLDPASEFIQELNDEWSLRVVNGGHSSEEARRRALLPVRVVTGTKDLVVKEDSAKGTYGCIDWKPVDIGHVNLVKPPTNKDTRYKVAKSFLISCRNTTPDGALLRLRELSDQVLKTRFSKSISDWDFRIRLHDPGQENADSTLLSAGFSHFSVERCKYVTNRDSDTALIGLAWGKTAINDAWDEDPIYVHQISNEDITSNLRTKLSKALEQVLRQTDEKQAWAAVFPSLSIDYSPVGTRDHHDLEAGKITVGDNYILREYKFPKNRPTYVNELVEIRIKFESIVPETAASYEISFPWLTLSFKGRAVFVGNVSDATSIQRLTGGNELQMDEERSKTRSTVSLETDDLVLPNSSVSLQWKRIK